MRQFLFFLSLLIIFYSLFFIPYSFAQDRFAVCDLCGYCPPNQPPSNWQSCVACLYPNITPNPFSRETLKINPTENIPPTPFPGAWYTMIGCINVKPFFSSGGLNPAEGKIGPGVQKILNIIFSVVGGISLLSLIYGSFVILTSQANPERLLSGKRIVYGAIVGLIFTLSVVFLVNFLASQVLKIPGFGK